MRLTSVIGVETISFPIERYSNSFIGQEVWATTELLNGNRQISIPAMSSGTASCGTRPYAMMSESPREYFVFREFIVLLTAAWPYGAERTNISLPVILSPRRLLRNLNTKPKSSQDQLGASK